MFVTRVNILHVICLTFRIRKDFYSSYVKLLGLNIIFLCMFVIFPAQDWLNSISC